MKPYYEDEAVTIYHGDCREILPAIQFQGLVVADPPYGISYNPSGGGKGWSTKTFDEEDRLIGDDAPFDPAVLIHFDRMILWGANHYANQLPCSPTWYVWDKRENFPSNDFSDCEFAWSNLGGPSRVFRHYWSGAIRASERAEQRVHPTQKPLALMRWCIEQSRDPNVLDPFMGSGTTLRAAKDLGRKAIGIEIEEKYCEIAAKRMAQGVLALERT